VSVAIGDLNADRRPDLATADADADSVSVLPNSRSPVVDLDPRSLDFGRQTIGAKGRVEKTIFVKNTGDAPLPIRDVRIVGTDSLDFALRSNCDNDSLADGARRIVGVRFAPSTEGDHSARVRVIDNAPDSPQVVPLSGAGIRR
jgi:hypothetical protein